MRPALLAVGVALLATVVVELFWTTLWVEGGAGPLTARLMPRLWGVLRGVGAEASLVRTLAGPLVLAVGLGTWVVLLWAGWAFVFASGEPSIVDTVDGGATTWSDSVYYAGYTVFTLGNGDFAPREGGWQVATTLAAGSGMLFITLSVSYVINVLDAVTQKRSFASNVHGLGTRGDEVLLAGWDGGAFEGLELPLHSFATQLNEVTSNHRAYPVLHYYHSRRGAQSPVVSVAVLDEALTLLEFGLPEGARPDDAVLKSARASVDRYRETLQGAFVEPATRSPPPPDLESLREAGVPTVTDAEFAAALEGVDDRRRTLLGAVESDGRQWPDNGANG